MLFDVGPKINMPKKPTIRQATVDAAIDSLSSGAEGNEAPSEFSHARSRIMYIECKAGGLTGDARIGRVFFSKSGKTIYYDGMTFQSLKGAGFKSNYFEVDSGAEYWISGPKKDGSDRLYGERLQIVVDDDVAEEYWTETRGLPGRYLESKKPNKS